MSAPTTRSSQLKTLTMAAGIALGIGLLLVLAIVGFAYMSYGAPEQRGAVGGAIISVIVTSLMFLVIPLYKKLGPKDFSLGFLAITGLKFVVLTVGVIVLKNMPGVNLLWAGLAVTIGAGVPILVGIATQVVLTPKDGSGNGPIGS